MTKLEVANLALQAGPAELNNSPNDGYAKDKTSTPCGPPSGHTAEPHAPPYHNSYDGSETNPYSPSPPGTTGQAIHANSLAKRPSNYSKKPNTPQKIPAYSVNNSSTDHPTGGTSTRPQDHAAHGTGDVDKKVINHSDKGIAVRAAPKKENPHHRMDHEKFSKSLKVIKKLRMLVCTTRWYGGVYVTGGMCQGFSGVCVRNSALVWRNF